MFVVILLLFPLPNHKLVVLSPHHSASIPLPALKFFFLSYPHSYKDVDWDPMFIWNKLFSNSVCYYSYRPSETFSCTPQQLSVFLLGTRTLCRFSSQWHSGGHRNALRQVGSLREMWAEWFKVVECLTIVRNVVNLIWRIYLLSGTPICMLVLCYIYSFSR